MTSKGFTEDTKNIETPNDINVSEKPLNPGKISSGRVDINVLKSKLEAEQGKELRRNIFIFFILCSSTWLNRNISVFIILFANNPKGCFITLDEKFNRLS